MLANRADEPGSATVEVMAFNDADDRDRRVEVSVSKIQNAKCKTANTHVVLRSGVNVATTFTLLSSHCG